MNINDVYTFWNNRPCNIRHSNKPIGTLEYFEEVTNRKYFVEPHIVDFAEFPKYKGLKVLEIGTGIGTDMISFVNNGAIYTGIDLTENAINIAKQRRFLYKIPEEQCRLYVGNVEDSEFLKLILGDEKFDLIYSFGVLHHTPDIDIAINNIVSYLKPNGTFKMMVYATNSWKTFKINEGLDQYEAQNGVPIARTFTHDEVNKLLRGYFNNINIYQTHIFPYKIEQYKNYEYEVEDYFKTMPEDMFKCLEKNLGFHLCITCSRNIVE